MIVALFIGTLAIVLGLWYAISWAAGVAEQEFDEYKDLNENQDEAGS